MNQRQHNILFVGVSGVPYSQRAIDAYLSSWFKIYLNLNNTVQVLNRTGTNNAFIHHEYNDNVKIDSIIKKNSNIKIFRFLLFILSYPIEAFIILKMNNKDKIDVFHLYSGHFIEFMHYFIISRMIGARIIYNYVELRSEKTNRSIYNYINGYISDSYGYLLFDSVISISHYIDECINKKAPKLNRIIVPPMCDFQLLDKFNFDETDEKYILFCGSVEYQETIKFIVDSYNSSFLKKSCQLRLVLRGSSKMMQETNVYVGNYSNIQVVSNLTYAELYRQYSNATGLLIPLRDKIEDKARFPNKICEYLACKGAIITTNIGEIPFYFKDGFNAIIANEYTIESYTDKLNQLALMTSAELDKIRLNAYDTGKNYFDLRSNEDEINFFLNNT